MSSESPPDSTLSAREMQIASAYAEGQSYKQVAQALGLAPGTVRTHLASIYRKLQVTSKPELIQAIASGPNGAGAADRDAEAMVAELALELDEALRRERILALILRIVSQQGHDPDALMDTVLDHALEICEAEFGILFAAQGEGRFRAMRSRNIAPGFGAWLAEQGVFTADPETGLGRMASGLAPVNITDVRGEEIYRTGEPLSIATAELGGARSFLAIPVIYGGQLLGALTIYRTRLHPFGERTLELAQLFADQAAIAIHIAQSRRPVALPETAPPLLAVLPFQPVDTDDTDLIRAGRRLAASISMELACSPLFRMIDRASSFSDRLDNVTPAQAAALLDAQLVVTGSIRRAAGGGLRVSVALYEAGNAVPRWSDVAASQGAGTSDLFEALLTRLCSAIRAGVERQMLEAARARRSADPSAMDHFLEGLERHHMHGSGDFLEARRHFESALVLDPDFARARSALAVTYLREWFWDSSRDDLLEATAAHARTAIGLAPHDAWAQTVWGVAALYRWRHADAAASFARALELAPHDSYVVSRAALGALYDGDFDRAVSLFEQAILLDPLHSDRQRGMLAHALFHKGDHAEAIALLEGIAAPLPWEIAWLAGCHAAAGNAAAAAVAAARYRTETPAPDRGYDVRRRPFRRAADLHRLEAAMRRAGI